MGDMLHGRKLTMKQFSLLLDEDNILLFYIKKAPLFKGKIQQKGERDSQSTSPLPAIFPHCEDAARHHHRPSKDILTRRPAGASRAQKPPLPLSGLVGVQRVARECGCQKRRRIFIIT